MIKKIGSKILKILKKIKTTIYSLRYFFPLFFFIGLIYDLIFYKGTSEQLYLLLMTLWLINIFNFKIKPYYTFVFGAAIYFIGFPFQFFAKDKISEISISLFIGLFVISLIQKFLEKGYDEKWN